MEWAFYLWGLIESFNLRNISYYSRHCLYFSQMNWYPVKLCPRVRSNLKTLHPDSDWYHLLIAHTFPKLKTNNTFVLCKYDFLYLTWVLVHRIFRNFWRKRSFHRIIWCPGCLENRAIPPHWLLTTGGLDLMLVIISIFIRRPSGSHHWWSALSPQTWPMPAFVRLGLLC